ncbi:unnamed protein product [Nippostrongylus brasiliensis]|uniref:RGS domain-containing protein n=1 Tax=Nippostrongylus brasiliensis TaxID=27835 RepID=A0A0N4XXA4_NIPBR|nr:unnamed protein product [Nippostrongylus brasiliensis]
MLQWHLGFRRERRGGQARVAVLVYRFVVFLESSELRHLDTIVHQEQPINFEVFETQKRQIQEALNAQTFHQFSAYAQQQFPGQPEQVRC